MLDSMLLQSQCNMDENGISIVHKPGCVIAELGHRNIWAVTSAEKRKTHTILVCTSAAGYTLSPDDTNYRRCISMQTVLLQQQWVGDR